MKKIIWHINLLYYILFIIFKKFHYLFNFINPVTWLMHSPIFKKKTTNSSKRTVFDIAEDSYNNEKSGVAIMWASRSLELFTVLIEIIILNIIQICTKFSILYFLFSDVKFLFFSVIFFVGISAFLNEVFVYRKYRYIKYFKEYKSLEEDKMDKYKFLFVLMLISTLTLLIITFEMSLELYRDML